MKKEFYIYQEQLNSINIYEYEVDELNFINNLNKERSQNTKRIQLQMIRNFLLLNNFIIKCEEINGYIPTEKGKIIGISTIQIFTKNKGVKLSQLVYSKKAQKFIINNMYYIIRKKMYK